MAQGLFDAPAAFSRNLDPNPVAIVEAIIALAEAIVIVEALQGEHVHTIGGYRRCEEQCNYQNKICCSRNPLPRFSIGMSHLLPAAIIP
jgi:hypothetical protein